MMREKNNIKDDGTHLANISHGQSTNPPMNAQITCPRLILM